MTALLDIVLRSYLGYAAYVWFELTHPQWHNYLWWLLGLSVAVWLIELLVPWRRSQKAIRKDFWLDAWYMLFNFTLFSLIGYAAVSDVVVHLVRAAAASVLGFDSLALIDVRHLPVWVQLLLLFVLRDFIQWNIHRLLHAVPALWEFHKVHHSVEEMGFAAHLRYHWMETVVYRALEYLPLALLGFGLTDFFAVHIVALTIGHLNHANVYLPVGPLRYLLNTPQMHIWHHAAELPSETRGVNFGLSLSVWDYLFGTAYMPQDGRDIRLGFDGVEQYPTTFLQQVAEPFRQLLRRQNARYPTAS